VDVHLCQGFAVLWDMDGVLVDSGALHRRAWRTFLSQKGQPVSDEIFERGFGRPNEQVLSEYWTGLSTTQIRRLGEEKEQCYRDLVKQEGIRATPGAVEWMGQFHDARIAQALATSGCQANADLITQLTGVRPYLAAIITAEDVSRGKPDPDVFLYAAALLDVAPTRCLVIEDSVHGVQAARAADMRCLALETTHPAAELCGADVVLPDMRAFSWSIWQGLFGRQRV
jgi:beta-phosphoglucomutase